MPDSLLLLSLSIHLINEYMRNIHHALGTGDSMSTRLGKFTPVLPDTKYLCTLLRFVRLKMGVT